MHYCISMMFVVSSVSLFCPVLLWSMFIAFEFSARFFALLPIRPERHRAQNKEEKNPKKSQCTTCVIHERNQKCRGTHRETVKDHLRYWYWYWYDTNRFSFYLLWKRRQERKERERQRACCLLLSNHFASFSSSLVVYLPNDNLYYFLSINVRLWNYSI